MKNEDWTSVTDISVNNYVFIQLVLAISGNSSTFCHCFLSAKNGLILRAHVLASHFNYASVVAAIFLSSSFDFLRFQDGN